MRKKTVKVEIDVPFHDVDGWKMVWHGHYYKYFEYARTAYLRAVGFDLDEMGRSGYLWPVIETHCRHMAPMRYGMRVIIKTALADVDHRIKFVFTILDKKTGQRLATGHTIQAAVNAKTGKLSLVTPNAFLRHVR